MFLKVYSKQRTTLCGRPQHFPRLDLELVNTVLQEDFDFGPMLLQEIDFHKLQDQIKVWRYCVPGAQEATASDNRVLLIEHDEGAAY